MAKSKTASTAPKKKAGRKKAAPATKKGVKNPPAARVHLHPSVELGLIERRNYPRFFLSGEQFKEIKSRRIFAVYDLSMTGLSIKVDEKFWSVGSQIGGILNIHPESIELTMRVVGYYGDRAALQFERMSTYARGVLAKALSPARLGKSLVLVREKLPMADFWFHGVCSTDLLIKLDEVGDLNKVEVFFANYYSCWSRDKNIVTGVFQTFGHEKLQNQLLASEPVNLESLSLILDVQQDHKKVGFARSLLESSPLDINLKQQLLSKFR